MNQFNAACCLVSFIMLIICIPLTLFVMLPAVFEYFSGNPVLVDQTLKDGSFVLFIGSAGFCFLILVLGSYLDGVV